MQKKAVGEARAEKQGEGNGQIEVVTVGVVAPAVAGPVAVAPAPLVEQPSPFSQAVDVLGGVEGFNQADALGSPTEANIGTEHLPLEIPKAKAEGIPVDLQLHQRSAEVNLGGAFLQLKRSRRPLCIRQSHIPRTTGQKLAAGAKAQPQQTRGEHLHRPAALSTEETDPPGMGLKFLQGSTGLPLGLAEDLASFQHGLGADRCPQG